MNLFASEEFGHNNDLELADADIQYYPKFLSAAKATNYFNLLLKETLWQQDDIKVFGKTYPQPRLTALYGDKNKRYGYSNIVMNPYPFSPILIQLKTSIEQIAGASFNVVLLNLYRTGSDSNGWHSDDEKALGENPVIASISLGATRKFQLRHKKDQSLKHSIELEHGSLLLMKGTTQHYWQHQIPKTKKVVDPRINLTFRYIK